jgi:hypothetical protein
MRSKLLIGGVGVAAALLLATTPVIAQAGGFLDGGDIKNNSLTGKDIKNNKLTGKDIKESKLGTVPSASNANTLAGNPATSYLDNVAVYSFNKTDGTTDEVTLVIPTTPGGTYDIAYSAYMQGGSGTSGCYLYRYNTASSTGYVYVGEERFDATNQPGASGSGVLSPTAGQSVELDCYSETDWTTDSAEPIQIVVTPLDSVTNGTPTATRPAAAARP